MNLQATLDAAVLIGLAVQFTKLADLLLLPRQQEALQKSLTRLRWRLGAMRPLEWYARVAYRRSVAAAEAVAVAVVIGVIGFPVAKLALQVFSVDLEVGPDGWFVLPASFNVVALAACVRSIYQPAIRDWLHSEGQFSVFLRRFALFVVCGGPGLALAMTIVGGFIFLSFEATPASLDHFFITFGCDVLRAYGMVALLLFAWLAAIGGLWATNVLASMLVVMGQAAIAVVAGVLVMVRGTVSRILEYNKGAWAAITLIVTCVLGIATVWMRT